MQPTIQWRVFLGQLPISSYKKKSNCNTRHRRRLQEMREGFDNCRGHRSVCSLATPSRFLREQMEARRGSRGELERIAPFYTLLFSHKVDESSPVLHTILTNNLDLFWASHFSIKPVLWSRFSKRNCALLPSRYACPAFFRETFELNTPLRDIRQS